MKNLKLLVFFLSLFVLTNKAMAHSQTDTIYYLLDTINTPVKDRIVSVEQEDRFVKCLKINCHCMKNYETPMFLYEVRRGIPLKHNVFGKLYPLTLVRLMELSRAVSDVDFGIKHVFYIIEPKVNDFIMYPAETIDSEPIIGDQQPIKTGG